jgi:hypothetical protein
VVTDSNTRHNHFWKLLKKERWYLVKLTILLDTYASKIIRFVSASVIASTSSSSGKEDANESISSSSAREREANNNKFEIGSEIGSLMFMNLRDILQLHRSLLRQLDDALQDVGVKDPTEISSENKPSLGTIFRTFVC